MECLAGAMMCRMPPRISKAALMASFYRVLAHHYDPRRTKWDIDGPAPNLSGASKSPRELPGYEGWLRNSHPEVRKQACLHCHQVNDILRQPAVAARTFDKKRNFEVWPLPENVGLMLERDHGLLVTNVVAGSAADNAGLKAGDVIGAAGGRRCFGQTDFRGVLHRGPRGAGEIEVWWTRGEGGKSGEVMSGKLAVVALRIIRMYSELPKNNTVAQVLGKQVLRSGTSVGANYREASRGRSKAEFVSKVGDSLKEIEGTEYWLELLVDSGCVSATKMVELLDETRQLIAIFTTVDKNAKG